MGALDVTANSICEIHCLALDEFDLNTAHKLSSEEKKIQRRRDSSPGRCWQGSKNASSVLDTTQTTQLEDRLPGGTTLHLSSFSNIR